MRRLLTGLAALSLLFGACNGAAEETPTTAAETTATDAPTTTEGTTTTSDDTTTTTATDDGMPPPPDAEGATSMEADVDGDGEPDTIHAYTSATGSRTLAVENAAGEVTSVDLPSPPETPPSIGGVADLGGEVPVILVELDTGSPTSFVMPYQLLEGELVQLSDENEEFISFTVGSDDLSREGLQCRRLEDLGAVIVFRRAISAGGEVFTVTETVFRLEESLLVQAAERDQYELNESSDADALDAIAAVDCPAA